METLCLEVLPINFRHRVPPVYTISEVRYSQVRDGVDREWDRELVRIDK